jgi:hypothetical protein
VIARSRGGGEDALLWPRLVLEGKEEGVGVWHGALKRRRGGGLAACTHHGRPMRRGAMASNSQVRWRRHRSVNRAPRAGGSGLSLAWAGCYGPGPEGTVPFCD